MKTIFSLNDWVLASVTQTLTKEEVVSLCTESLAHVKENYFGDMEHSLIDYLRQEHQIYPVYTENVEKQPIHVELEVENDSPTPAFIAEEDLPF